MVIVFIIGGSFSFMVEDALKRAADAHQEEQERLVEAASTKPEFPSTVSAHLVDDRYNNVGG